MAENPVLTEARKRGIISTGTTSAGVKSSAATQSGSANPVVQEYNGTKAQERAASQQRIVETARQRTATQTQASEPQPKTDGLLSAILSTAERVKNTVSGAVKSTASAYTNAAGMAAEGAGKWNTRIANYTNKDTLQSAQEAVERYQAMLDSGKWADGRTMTAADRKQVQSMLEANQRKLTAQESYTNAVEASDKAVANQAYQTADRLAESSAQNLATAKEGLGKVGQFAVDLGSQGVQMAGDIAASAIIPGSGLALMGVRSGASSAQEARQSGATYGQQLAYGLGSGAVSIATEKLSSVAAPFKKAFGGGVLDEALSKTVSKMNGSAVGKAVLSMLSEGGEEAVEDLVQPILQRMTYDRDALGQYGDADYWAQMLYDGLVGAAMGGIGSGVEAVQNRIASKKTTGNAAGAQTAAREGNDVTPAQNAPQAAQTPSQAGIMEQETARLFGQNNAAPETGTAGSKYDMFQAAAIRKDSKTFRNLVAGFDTSVSEFFNKWREGRSNTTTEKLEKLYLGKMSENAKSKVSAILGYDIDTRDMIVTNDDVKHIIDSHGSAEAELQRGNLPLEQWAIDALPDVVTQPDSITPGEIQSSGKHPGKQGVLFSKTMPNGTVVTVQFDNKGRKTMELTTMYVKKAAPTLRRSTWRMTPRNLRPSRFLIL